MLRRLLRIGERGQAGPTELIVGLGNPGKERARNRHNVGFQVLDRFAGKHGLSFDRMEFQGLLARGSLYGRSLFLLKPLSFMNRSGAVVKPVMSKHRVELEDLLVIYDDLDLPLGKLRVRSQGGSGGHRGMDSLISALGTQAFSRLRIGIGRPDGSAPEEYVLRDFTVDESIAMESAYEDAVAAVECFMRTGIAVTMERYNQR
jgi:PTH1 family peptidyl-tRNA hydrolase